MTGFTDRSLLQPTTRAERMKPVTLRLRIIERRVKSVLVAELNSAVTYWLPLAEIRIEEAALEASVTMPTWLAVEKGLNVSGAAPGQRSLF
jgi:hypothetical protein